MPYLYSPGGGRIFVNQNDLDEYLAAGYSFDPPGETTASPNQPTYPPWVNPINAPAGTISTPISGPGYSTTSGVAQLAAQIQALDIGPLPGLEQYQAGFAVTLWDEDNGTWAIYDGIDPETGQPILRPLAWGGGWLQEPKEDEEATGLDQYATEWDKQTGAAEQGDRPWASIYAEEFASETDAGMLWPTYLWGRIKKEIDPMAEAVGEDPVTLAAWISTQFVGMLNHIQETVINPAIEKGAVDENGHTHWTGTPGGLEQLERIAWSYFQARDNRLFGAMAREAYEEAQGSRGGGGRGGGGGGVAVDRNFIKDQILKLWRAYLLEEPKNLNELADSYIAEWKRNPAKQLNLESWLVRRMNSTSRWASIYRSKPASMGEIEFMQPYLQAARQLMGPDSGTEAAIGGAQFAASQPAFTARLQRSREYRSQAPFISKLESRLEELRKIAG